MIKWHYAFDRKAFTTTPACYGHRVDVLVARLDNSEYWFLPYTTVTMITLGTFVRHVRRLAQAYGATEVWVTTLDRLDIQEGMFFKYQSMFASDLLSADRENWEHAFWLCDFDKSVLFSGKRMYESQVFPSLRTEAENHKVPLGAE